MVDTESQSQFFRFLSRIGSGSKEKLETAYALSSSAGYLSFVSASSVVNGENQSSTVFGALDFGSKRFPGSHCKAKKEAEEKDFKP
jgi:hypothetical protein